MKPHPRIRKTIKWGGAAVTVLLVVVWIGSGWVSGYWQSSSRFGVGISAGLIGFDRAQPPTTINGMAFDSWASGWPGPGWHLNRRLYDMRWAPTRVKVLNVETVDVPVWTVTTFFALVTAFAWRLDTLARRRERVARLNLCPKCNYDRAGLAAGAKCPECGVSASGLDSPKG